MPSRTNGLLVPSAIKLGQIRSVDRRLLVRLLGALEFAAMRQVDGAIKISLGLVQV